MSNHLSTMEQGFGMNTPGTLEGFDIDAAFQEAIRGVASDAELDLDERVRRMAVIVSEGTSETYRDFVDFRQMAAQMQMMCNHDHSLSQFMQENEILSGFMDSHKTDDGHNHGAGLPDKHTHKKDDDEYETDPKTGKKTKKKRFGWLSILMK